MSPGTQPRIVATESHEEGAFGSQISSSRFLPLRVRQGLIRSQAFFCFPSVLQVLAALQEMPRERVLTLRQQTQFLWDAYFSSVEKVIHTTLEVRGTRLSQALALDPCFLPPPFHLPLPGHLLSPMLELLP
jgi:hypothetical protein